MGDAHLDLFRRGQILSMCVWGARGGGDTTEATPPQGAKTNHATRDHATSRGRSDLGPPRSRGPALPPAPLRTCTPAASGTPAPQAAGRRTRKASGASSWANANLVGRDRPRESRQKRFYLRRHRTLGGTLRRGNIGCRPGDSTGQDASNGRPVTRNSIFVLLET